MLNNLSIHVQIIEVIVKMYIIYKIKYLEIIVIGCLV